MGATGIQWGAYNGKLHLGIEYRWDDIGIYSDTSHVYADVYYAANAWGYNSAETITYSGSAGGSVNYTLYSATGSSDTHFIATVDFGVQSTSYSGGPSWSLGVSTTPAYDGSAPSVTVGFTLPARPPTVPNPPPTGVDSITSSSARIVVGAAYDNGSGVDWYGAWVMTNNAWPDSGGNVVASAAGGTFTATGLAPGTQYFYTARAHNAVGYSGYTDMKVFTTAAAPPSAPGVTIDQITSSSLRVTVATPAANGAAIDSYQFQVATDSGFANVVSWPAVQQGTVSGLARVTVYYIRGSAHNSAGWSSWGPTSSVQTLATVPDQTATPSVSAILTDSASVAWSAPNNGGSAITGYDVQVATDSGFTANVVQVLGATTSPRTLSPLLPGTGYFARVRANNAVGAGAWSPAASFTTLSGLKVKVDGAWLTTRVWVKIDGSWRLAKVWKRVDGAWLT